MASDIKTSDIYPFYYKKFNGRFLVTNEIGNYYFLKPSEFHELADGKLRRGDPLYKILSENNFIVDKNNIKAVIDRFRNRNRFIWKGPTLHIIVPTIRCDHKCLYCQASARTLNAKNADMKESTAKRVIDIIFESPSDSLSIEFQGGEPLLRIGLIRFIINYLEKKNRKFNKKIDLCIVSNFSHMSDKILEFCIKHNIRLSTSLDGPAFLHNRQRISKEVNSYANTVYWLKRIKKEFRRRKVRFSYGALPTITKFSLRYPTEIIDEYRRLGFNNIHLRPVTRIGSGKEFKSGVSYSYEDFISFYRKSMDYIIDINLKGELFSERLSMEFLYKIFSDREVNYLDLRSPCGAGIGQLVYNHDGKVFICDEGRMVAEMGDDIFCLGNVHKNRLKDFINNDAVKATCMASCLDILPGCNQCVYKPYCGICPVYNYVEEGNIFRNNIQRCKIQAGMLDYLFEKIRNREVRKEVFHKWLNFSVS